ncbi:MAG: Txe/YoeB family addiction module toxin [Clostridium sp.]|nr:Txe/YoeB family addiction module toxin [Clostridium sp.]
MIIEARSRNEKEGVGKPEPLTGNLTELWSRRMNDKNRLIYKIDEENVYILACSYHYGEN